MASSSILSGREDHYQGLIVDPVSLPSGKNVEETFGRMLDASLIRWKEQQYRGIWLKLERHSHARLIPVACDRGFEFHHAEQEYLMMTKWLPEDVPTECFPSSWGWGIYF